MSVRALLNRNAALQAVLARNAFVATHSVQLLAWLTLDQASSWCEQQWQQHGLHYRRYVIADRQKALFEFANDGHAIGFLVRFGSECRSLAPSKPKG